MSLLKLLEKIQSGLQLQRPEAELLESIELHLRVMVDVLGFYVETNTKPDQQMVRILVRFEEMVYGNVQEAERGTCGGPNCQDNQGAGQRAL